MNNITVGFQIWLGRAVAVALFVLPLFALAFGPRTGDDFIDLLRLSALCITCMPMGILVANFANDVAYTGAQ